MNFFLVHKIVQQYQEEQSLQTKCVRESKLIVLAITFENTSSLSLDKLASF